MPFYPHCDKNTTIFQFNFQALEQNVDLRLLNDEETYVYHAHFLLTNQNFCTFCKQVWLGNVVF